MSIDIKHLQRVLLGMAKDLDKFCRENNIEYYLIGGSAIGAIRHKGFIPWDDDFDIAMTHDNYMRFIELAPQKLNLEKYVVQVGDKDWALLFTKIKLKETVCKEVEDNGPSQNDCQGIYIDIFPLDNVSDNPIMARWQYICAKYLLCWTLSKRGYKSASWKKKILMAMAFPLNIKWLRNVVAYWTTAYNRKQTHALGFFYGITRWKNAVVSRDYYGTPLYVPFEDTELPVPEQYDLYLKHLWGDYMQLPPVKERQGKHILYIDFGKY